MKYSVLLCSIFFFAQTVNGVGDWSSSSRGSRSISSSGSCYEGIQRSDNDFRGRKQFYKNERRRLLARNKILEQENLTLASLHKPCAFSAGALMGVVFTLLLWTASEINERLF